jgi:hypothetical protein
MELNSLKKLAPFINEMMDLHICSKSNLHYNSELHHLNSNDLDDQIMVKKLLNVESYIFVDCLFDIKTEIGDCYYDPDLIEQIRQKLPNVIRSFYQSYPRDKVSIKFRFSGQVVKIVRHLPPAKAA